MLRYHLPLLVAGFATLVTAEDSAQRSRSPTAPEAFTAQLQARTDAGALASNIRLQIDRYTPEQDRKVMTDALKHGGYAAFLAALRKAPVVGSLVLGDLKVALRWAREEKTPKGREILLVTDEPVYFVGGGRANPKPREGFELAIVRLTVDEIGLGSGSLVAAGRVKPDGTGGAVVEDYAAEPIKLTFVSRVIA